MSKANILIAEDSPALAMLITKSLSGEGYEAKHAADGEAARRLIESGKERFDLIISDNDMPGLTGLDLAAWLRSRDEFKRLPIILVTASEKYALFGKAVGSGLVNAYLTKPFSTQTLVRLVGTFLTRLDKK